MVNFDRNNVGQALIKKRLPLTKESSSKEIWHISLELLEIPLHFEPGDSVGIYAQNDPDLVEHLIFAMRAKPSTTIIDRRLQQTLPLTTFLTHRANLSRITSSFLKLIYESEPSTKAHKEMQYLLEDRPLLRKYLSEKDPLSLLREFSTTPIAPQQLCDQFGPLLPRFYSVASCMKTDPTTLDLTVALFTWMQNGEKRYGVASHFLCHLAKIRSTPISLFVQPSPHFRLPKDPRIPLIMIGPGTGVAPFRAFLQRRKKEKATGDQWLFFGGRNRKSDFLYEEDWKEHKNLRIDTAFSRDQKEKIYVQHELEKHAKELYTWIEKGAYLYLCGDAKEMTRDVEHTLCQVLRAHGNCDEQEAKERLKQLRKLGRYSRDIY